MASASTIAVVQAIIEFGIMKWSISITETASKLADMTHTMANAKYLVEKFSPAPRKRTQVSNSTAGYRLEIDLPQYLHFPLRISHEITGMLSRLLICVLHSGQNDLGRDTDCPEGTL